jgi:gas vesicle protein
MSDQRTDALMAFLLGAAVGAGVALLVAPQSGEETRRQLGDKAKRLGDDVDEKLRTAKEEVKARAGDVKTAIGAGREAFTRARTGEDPSSAM